MDGMILSCKPKVFNLKVGMSSSILSLKMLAAAQYLRSSTFYFVRHFSYQCIVHIRKSRIRSHYAHYWFVNKIPNDFFCYLVNFFSLQEKFLGEKDGRSSEVNSEMIAAYRPDVTMWFMH